MPVVLVQVDPLSNSGVDVRVITPDPVSNTLIRLDKVLSQLTGMFVSSSFIVASWDINGNAVAQIAPGSLVVFVDESGTIKIAETAQPLLVTGPPITIHQS